MQRERSSLALLLSIVAVCHARALVPQNSLHHRSLSWTSPEARHENSSASRGTTSPPTTSMVPQPLLRHPTHTRAEHLLHDHANQVQPHRHGHRRIQKLLWQTARTNDLPPAAQQVRATWEQLNPQLPIRLHNDTQASRFINRTFLEDVSLVYHHFPLGVMRADFWRYAMLYIRGGIYADVDTRCKKPLASWLPPEDGSAAGLPLEQDYTSKLTWKTCSVVIGLENDKHFCQWTIASSARHPLLESVLQLITKRAQEAGRINVTDVEFVHKHTGPAIWTEAIVEYLKEHTSAAAKLGKDVHTAADVFRAVYTDSELFEEVVKGQGICLVGKEFMNGHAVANEYASRLGMQGVEFKKEWEGWDSWVWERKVIRNSTNPWVRRGRSHT